MVSDNLHRVICQDGCSCTSDKEQKLKELQGVQYKEIAVMHIPVLSCLAQSKM